MTQIGNRNSPVPITTAQLQDGLITSSKLADDVVSKLGPEILTTAERLALSNTSFGKLVFDTDFDKLFVYNGANWEQIISGVDGDFAVPLSFDTLNLGNAACGGFYIGAVNVGSQRYALIVAPNATGCACCQWKTTNTATSGTGSCVDGRSNTYGPMDNADHPAGNWTATRTINGFSDWYLPARDELNQLYVNDGGATNTNLPAGEGFAAGFYWSSTENSATNACNQTFANGGQTNCNKTLSLRVRAIRREPI